jgi:hypothetical protein
MADVNAQPVPQFDSSAEHDAFWSWFKSVNPTEHTIRALMILAWQASRRYTQNPQGLPEANLVCKVKLNNQRKWWYVRTSTLDAAVARFQSLHFQVADIQRMDHLDPGKYSTVLELYRQFSTELPKPLETSDVA